MIVNVQWYTLEEKVPEHKEHVLIATIRGCVVEVNFYADPTGETFFMNDTDQEWSLEEVQYWTPWLAHPKGEV